MPEAKPHELELTARELAQRLGVHVDTVKRLCHMGASGSRKNKTDGWWLIRFSEFEPWYRARRTAIAQAARERGKEQGERSARGTGASTVEVCATGAGPATATEPAALATAIEPVGHEPAQEPSAVPSGEAAQSESHDLGTSEESVSPSNDGIEPAKEETMSAKKSDGETAGAGTARRTSSRRRGGRKLAAPAGEPHLEELGPLPPVGTPRSSRADHPGWSVLEPLYKAWTRSQALPPPREVRARIDVCARIRAATVCVTIHQFPRDPDDWPNYTRSDWPHHRFLKKTIQRVDLPKIDAAGGAAGYCETVFGPGTYYVAWRGAIWQPLAHELVVVPSALDASLDIERQVRDRRKACQRAKARDREQREVDHDMLRYKRDLLLFGLAEGARRAPSCDPRMLEAVLTAHIERHASDLYPAPPGSPETCRFLDMALPPPCIGRFASPPMPSPDAVLFERWLGEHTTAVLNYLRVLAPTTDPREISAAVHRRLLDAPELHGAPVGHPGVERALRPLLNHFILAA